jgi:hypothetical protein
MDERSEWRAERADFLLRGSMIVSGIKKPTVISGGLDALRGLLLSWSLLLLSWRMS